MDIVDYVPEFGEYILLDGLREELTGKSIEERMRYSGAACFYDVALVMGWGRPRDSDMEKRVFRMGEDEYVKGVIVDDGIIVGLYIDCCYEGQEVSLSKEVEWYRCHVTLCKEFAETDH